MDIRELNGQATRAGFTKESFGEWMNLARRYSRLGNALEAAYCAERALKVWDRFPHLKHCDGQMPEDVETQLRAKAQSYISAI